MVREITALVAGVHADGLTMGDWTIDDIILIKPQVNSIIKYHPIWQTKCLLHHEILVYQWSQGGY